MSWKKLLGLTQSALRGARNTTGPSLTPGPASSSLDLTELEDRILMSATPIALDALPDADLNEPIDVDHSLDEVPHPDLLVDSSDGASLVTDRPLSESVILVDDVDESVAPTTRHELIFVDTSVNGYQELLGHIADSHDESTLLEVFELDNTSDGVEQISDILEQYDELDAVHIVSHGNDGAVRLGDVWLNADQMPAYAGDISQWSDAFTSDGDLLLYGCNLASTSQGQEFLDGLHALTGADIAASTDTTGHASLGGDWDLEFTIGHIETDLLLSQTSQQAWAFVLPTEYVYDGFESHDYFGNSGSVPWTGGWQEVGDDTNARSGDVSVAHYDLDAFGNHSVQIKAAAETGLYREVDLGTASSATLYFDYQRHNISGFLDSTLEVQVSDNGGSTWSTAHTIGAGTDAFTQSVALDLTPYMESDTQIRFLSTATGSGSIFIDHVDVTYEPNIAPVLQIGDPLTLSNILEDAVTNSGNTVASILASAGDDRITDANVGALEGIAVIRTDDTNGAWQYDAHADGTWIDFGNVSNGRQSCSAPRRRSGSSRTPTTAEQAVTSSFAPGTRPVVTLVTQQLMSPSTAAYGRIVPGPNLPALPLKR